MTHGGRSHRLGPIETGLEARSDPKFHVHKSNPTEVNRLKVPLCFGISKLVKDEPGHYALVNQYVIDACKFFLTDQLDPSYPSRHRKMRRINQQLNVIDRSR